MHEATRKLLAALLVGAASLVSNSGLAKSPAIAATAESMSTADGSLRLAQAGPSPRETPPQDLEPRVNTSATPPADTSAREAPRPQDVEPAVDTSAPSRDAGVSTGAASKGASANPAPGGASVSPSAGGKAPSSRKPGNAATTAGSAGAGTTTVTGQTAGAPAKAGKGKALDRLELDTTQITGNRELPKVLYIVPWKRADLGDLLGKPVNSLLDEVLTPVDRDVFKRENRYYRALTPGEASPGASAAGESSPAAGSSAAPATGTASPPVSSDGSAAPGRQDER